MHRVFQQPRNFDLLVYKRTSVLSKACARAQDLSQLMCISPLSMQATKANDHQEPISKQTQMKIKFVAANDSMTQSLNGP